MELEHLENGIASVYTEWSEIDEFTPEGTQLELKDASGKIVTGVYRAPVPVLVKNATPAQLARCCWNDGAHRWEIPGGVFVSGVRVEMVPTAWRAI
jgi:hypothetical protein